MRFRKKALVIDAVQYGGAADFNSIREFVGNALPLHRLGDQKLGIQTLEGMMTASPGDWIIKGIRGEFYPCKPDIFAATYYAVKPAVRGTEHRNTHTLEMVHKKFDRLVIKSEGCWGWRGYVDHAGYGKICAPAHLFGWKQIAAHRMSWILTYGPIPPKMFVCHKCDNPICSRPDHLFIGTHDDNMRDMARKGRARSGRNLTAKLNLGEGAA
jgi:hypothetical protein